mgnify:CR=1 FL=1
MNEDIHLESQYEETIAEVAAFDDDYWNDLYAEELDNEWDEDDE